MRPQTKRHKLTRLARRHARAAFMAAAGFVASATAHAQHAPVRAAPPLYAVAQFAPPADASAGTATHPAGAASDASPARRAYLDANRRVLTGQADLAAAMGLTGAAGQAANAAGTLGDDDTAAADVSAATLSRIGGARQSVALALSQAFVSTPGAPLDRDAFRTGLAVLGEGLQRFEGLRQGTPDQIDAAAATLHDAVRYASLHGIDVPSVASAALRRVTR